jgi:acyl-CoA reductase-like NAD-dependent aldehyde dehydrogenase
MSTPTAFWLAGRQATGEDSFDVTNAWDGRVVGTVSVPTAEQVEEAVAAAHAAEALFAATPAHVRSAALDHVAKGLTERSEEIAQLISAENGKPVKWARGEVGRAVSVFRWASEEARRFNSGEAQRLDTDAGGVGRLALTRRFPRGSVLGIARARGRSSSSNSLCCRRRALSTGPPHTCTPSSKAPSWRWPTGRPGTATRRTCRWRTC